MENDRVQANPVQEGKGEGELLNLLRENGSSDLQDYGDGHGRHASVTRKSMNTLLGKYVPANLFAVLKIRRYRSTSFFEAIEYRRRMMVS